MRPDSAPVSRPVGRLQTRERNAGRHSMTMLNPASRLVSARTSKNQSTVFTKISYIRHNLNTVMDAEAIKRSLEGSGLRCTPQRYAVMACLMDHKRASHGCGNLQSRESRGSAFFKGHDL